MSFILPDLPYAAKALEPYMSAATLDLHHGKHHRGYVTKLNEMTQGRAFAGLSLEDVVRKASGDKDATAIFNNAAQHLNHSFFWACMKPGGSAAPEKLRAALSAKFGSFDAFKKKFTAEGMSQFGSGWVWLVQGKDGLEIVRTGNADNPLTQGKRPLLVCDIWEHAYYVDYQNRRADFLANFVGHLTDWEAVAQRLSAA